MDGPPEPQEPRGTKRPYPTESEVRGFLIIHPYLTELNYAH